MIKTYINFQMKILRIRIVTNPGRGLLKNKHFDEI